MAAIDIVHTLFVHKHEVFADNVRSDSIVLRVPLFHVLHTTPRHVYRIRPFRDAAVDVDVAL